MSTIKPAYRWRVYKPWPNEAEVLVPAAGAPHSDALQYATVAGVAGYKPYLDFPSGRRGRIDPLTKRTDIGEIVFGSFDPRTTPGQGSNAVRHFSAYVGDAGGIEQLKGLKVEVDESTDGGSTWALWLTGRIASVALDEPQWFEVAVRDTSDELRSARCFVGKPHSSIAYATMTQLCPLGLAANYGPFKASAPLIGTIVDGGGGTRSAKMVEGATGRKAAHNIVSRAFRDHLLLGYVLEASGLAMFEASKHLRARLKRLDTQATGEFRVTSNINNASNLAAGLSILLETRSDGHHALNQLYLEPLETTDPSYLALPPVGTSVEIRVLSVGAPSDDAPILLDDQHPVQAWKDMNDGKFGTLEADGDVLRSFPYDGAAFTTLINDATFGVRRFQIRRTDNLHAWIEQNILQDGNLGYRTNVSGQIVPVDMRLPTSLAGLQTITDADLAERGVPRWSTDRDTALTTLRHSYFGESALDVERVAEDDAEYPDVPANLIVDVEHEYVRANIGRRELGERELAISGLGLRASLGETREGMARRVWVERRIGSLFTELSNQYAAGALEATIPGRRSTVINGLAEGDWVLVQLSMLPDPATHQRGGTRLMRVVEKSPQRLDVDLRVVDSGLTVQAAVPTVGALGQEVNNTRHGITVPITVNAAVTPVRVEIAITDPSAGSAPVESSSAWTFAATVTATSTLTIRSLPSNKRIWVRARSEPSSPIQLPSAWVFSTGDDFQNTASITGPSNVSASGLTSSTATIAWTNGDANLPVELLYVTPSSGTPALVLTLRQGTTRHTLYGLASNVSHKVQARHPDGFGGYSADPGTGEVTFSTTTTPPVAPAAPTLGLLVGIA